MHEGPFTAFRDALIRPRDLFKRQLMARRRHAGLDAMVITGALYALFCVLLYAARHEPSFTGVPIPARHYYLAQALFVTPLLAAGWWIYGRVAHTLATRLGGGGQRAATLAALGYAYGPPLAALYVLPDLVVFLAAGFDALAPAMRIYAPICLVAILASSTLAVSITHRISKARALVAVLPAFLLQAVLVAAFLR